MTKRISVALALACWCDMVIAKLRLLVYLRNEWQLKEHSGVLSKNNNKYTTFSNEEKLFFSLIFKCTC